MKDYLVTVSVKNNRIISAIESSGFGTVTEFCEFFEISRSAIYPLINMRESPLNADGSLKKWVPELLCALSCTLEDLFSEQQIWSPLKVNKQSFEVSHEDIERLTGCAETAELSDEADKDFLVGYMENAISLSPLTRREREVLEMRFGIKGSDLTLEQCAKKLDVTKERVRQVEARALRRLRTRETADRLSGYQ